MQTLILIGLVICHFMADFTNLSTPWMLRAKAIGKPLFPIFCHALIHAILMTFFLFFFVKNIDNLINLFILQLITHFSIDTVKGQINNYFPSVKDNKNALHWYVFGFDQLLHYLVIILMSHVAVY